MNLENVKVTEGKGKIVVGGAGCGKTTTLIDEVIKCDNPRVFCYTNKACDVIRKELVKRKCNKADCVSTFDSHLNTYKGGDSNTDKLKNKTIFVDEYSMVPNKWMTLLYRAFVSYRNTVSLIGDSNQCDPVDSVVYDYVDSPAVKQMCPTTVKLKYNEKTASHDRQTHGLFENFLRTGTVNYKLGELTATYTNICYYNKTRRRINK
jgi:hypothetical protein